MFLHTTAEGGVFDVETNIALAPSLLGCREKVMCCMLRQYSYVVYQVVLKGCWMYYWLDHPTGGCLWDQPPGEIRRRSLLMSNFRRLTYKSGAHGDGESGERPVNSCPYQEALLHAQNVEIHLLACKNLRETAHFHLALHLVRTVFSAPYLQRTHV